MRTIVSAIRGQVVPSVLSVALLICAAVWFVGACVWYPSKGDWSAIPLVWMLILMVAPALCFSMVYVVVDTRKRLQLSRLDRCALAVAFFPVALGSLLAVWVVKSLFWTSFQDASMWLKVFGALACAALAVISATMTWRAATNLMSSGAYAERVVA